MNGNQTIKKLNLETVMSERFSRYSKSIIQQRALPDVRDGLKPVQRRILYAMDKDGNTYNKAYRKSAKAVGNVMGNFHPHGDSSIYEALIHMSQTWKMRIPLIDLHGNNGSIDEDPPAAMRYTEARLSKQSSEMLRDLNKGTVDWVPNFDDTEYEPIVLPSRFPNLLVNGATGISSGYATNIPPHNLGEVIDALIYLQFHPNATLDELMGFIKGPDFPTGGIIQGRNQLKRAYQTGRGKVIVRSRIHIKSVRGNKKQAIVSEIPYGVNKKRLVKQMDAIRLTHKINGIGDVEDESGRKGLRIVISFKRNADIQGILNYLYKNTDLQIAYHFNDVAIDHMQPKRLSLKSMLVSYLDFQRSIITKRTIFDLNQVHKKQEIVLGFIKAMNEITKVIQTIRSSKNHLNARNNLIRDFNFTKRQANAIVALQLYRLTNTNIIALKNENVVLNRKITLFESILNSHTKLDAVLMSELLKIKKAYNTPRRTTIQNQVQSLHVSKQVTVPNEDVVVLVSHNGFLKRSSLHSFKASNTSQNGLKANDFPLFVKHMNTRNHVFIFTNKGNLIYRPVIKIKNSRWKDTGQHISQEIGLNPDESILNVIPFKSLKNNGKFLITTSDGYIKKVSFKNLKPGRNYRTHAFRYIKLHHKNAHVVNVTYLPNNMSNGVILLISKFGFATKFELNEIPTIGKNGRGVKAMNLKNGDKILNLQLVTHNDLIGMITAHSRFKIVPTNDIPVSHRNRRGVHIMKFAKQSTDSLADFIKINQANPQLYIFIYTTYRKLLSLSPSHFKVSNRTAKGQKIINTTQQGQPKLLLY